MGFNEFLLVPLLRHRVDGRQRRSGYARNGIAPCFMFMEKICGFCYIDDPFFRFSEQTRGFTGGDFSLLRSRNAILVLPFEAWSIGSGAVDVILYYLDVWRN